MLDDEWPETVRKMKEQDTANADAQKVLILIWLHIVADAIVALAGCLTWLFLSRFLDQKANEQIRIVQETERR